MTRARTRLLREMAEPGAYLWSPRTISGYRVSNGRNVGQLVCWSLRNAGLIDLDPADTERPRRWIITDKGRAFLRELDGAK